MTKVCSFHLIVSFLWETLKISSNTDLIKNLVIVKIAFACFMPNFVAAKTGGIELAIIYQ